MARIHRYEYLLEVFGQEGINIARKKTVDCACGDGHGSIHLKNAGAIVTAIDIEQSAVEKCRKMGIEDVRQGDICDLKLPDDYCDLFFCSETLEHLEESDCSKAAQEIQKATNSGGTICVTVPKHRDRCFAKEFKGIHKTYVQSRDIEKWFDQCRVIFRGTFFKNPKNPKQSNLVMILRLKNES